jgi:hypothetical protein
LICSGVERGEFITISKTLGNILGSGLGSYLTFTISEDGRFEINYVRGSELTIATTEGRGTRRTCGLRTTTAEGFGSSFTTGVMGFSEGISSGALFD